MPLSPKTPAISATTRKVTAQFNIDMSSFPQNNFRFLQTLSASPSHSH
jgi:hypothetical protein